jgi:hypothetical protein
LLAIGCHQTVQVHEPATSTPTGSNDAFWAHYYLFGFIGKTELDLRDHCASSSIESVHITSNPLTILVSVGTLGIYVPRKVSIHCFTPTPP